MNRRVFLRSAFAASVSAPAFAAGYGLFESGWVRIDRQSLPLARLPKSLDGTTIAFLADLHHGPFTPIDYVAAVVRTTLVLNPDLIVLGGDYSLRDGKYIRPCFEVLEALRAPLGVFGVLGNHDYWHGVGETRAGMKAARDRVDELGVGEARLGPLRLAGWTTWTGHRISKRARRPTHDDACLLISHNRISRRRFAIRASASC